MVTFSCEVCNESMLKKKADQHTYRCHGAYFTCIDCSRTFNGDEYRLHTQCITEDQKYQGALYRPKKKQQPQQQQQPKQQKSKVNENAEGSQKEEKKIEKKNKVSNSSKFDLKQHKGKGLYKVLKNFSKDEKKELLKRIVISDDGKLEVK